MLRSLMNFLTKATPLLLLLFIIIAVCQIFFLLPATTQKFYSFYENLVDHSRIIFLPLAFLSLILVLAGYGYERSSNRLARQGLRRRKGVLSFLFDRLTNRQNMNDMLARTYQDTTLDSSEFAASLRARIFGQDRVCEDIAQQIKLRLMTQKRHRPTGIFLFLGPAGTGKKFLAQQIARQLKRPCFILNPNDYTQDEPSLPSQVTDIIKQNPRAVLVVPDCRSLSSKNWSQLSGKWLNRNNVSSLFQGVIFIFTETVTENAQFSDFQDRNTAEDRRMFAHKAAQSEDIQAELINQCDRIFLFSPLQTENIARVSALLLEQMIKDYGLSVEAGGIDSNMILPFIRQQQHHSLTAHEIIRLIEDQIGESLIALSQKSPATIQLSLDQREGRPVLMVRKISPEQERLTPVLTKG